MVRPPLTIFIDAAHESHSRRHGTQIPAMVEAPHECEMTISSDNLSNTNRSAEPARAGADTIASDPGNQRIKEYKKHDPYTRTGRLLEALDKLQDTMTVELWQVFIPDYARHYLQSLKLGEHPLHPGDYFNEWAVIRRIGQIPPDTDREPFYSSRKFNQYESPKSQFWL